MDGTERVRKACVGCGRHVYQRIESCPSCGSRLVDVDAGGKLNREEFWARRNVCSKCHQWDGESCRILGKPCKVESRWVRPGSDWCPIGKDVLREMHRHTVFTDDPDTFVKIELPLEKIEPPSSRFAIVTHAFGDNYMRCREVSRESMLRYAARVGADFIELCGDHCPDFKLGNKFRVAQVARHYESTLWLDVDVIINDHAPSIFEETPADRFCIYDEKTCASLEGNGDWAIPQAELVARSQGIPFSGLDWSGNAGIMKIPGTLASLYDPPDKPLPTHWCAEQQLITVRLLAKPESVFLMDWKWNCQRNGRYWHQKSDAYFVHFNGVFGWQLAMEMERYCAGQLQS